jgi:hypothetical protein
LVVCGYMCWVYVAVRRWIGIGLRFELSRLRVASAYFLVIMSE